MDPAQHDHARTRQRSRWVFYGFLAIGGFLLFTEHRAHALGLLPYLLLLACPLMHLFMHHGHGGHHATKTDQPSGGAGPTQEEREP